MSTRGFRASMRHSNSHALVMLVMLGGHGQKPHHNKQKWLQSRVRWCYEQIQLFAGMARPSFPQQRATNMLSQCPDLQFFGQEKRWWGGSVALGQDCTSARSRGILHLHLLLRTLLSPYLSLAALPAAAVL